MRPIGRAIAATLGALGAYVSMVLPQVRRELRKWGPLPPEKVKNAEAVAVFATLSPRSRRAAALRAILALQVAIDLRDVQEENAASSTADDTALLERLEASWRREVAALPAYEAVEGFLTQAIARCEEGQRRTHAAAACAVESLQAWSLQLGAQSEYRWWEVAAGASSSVAAHALIAAAADPDTTAAQAAAIDAAYNPPIGALTVLLDDLVDLEQDREAGEHNYVGYYAGSAEASERLAWIAERSRRLIESLPRTRRHEAILAGVAAFYLSSPETAPPIRERLLPALGPGARILVAFMRLRGRRRSGQAGNSPGP
jgi:hypothetical protein